MSFGDLKASNVEISDEGEFFLSPNIAFCHKTEAIDSKEQQSSRNFKNAGDIYNLGLLLLECATGGIESMFGKDNERVSNNCCCMIHCKKSHDKPNEWNLYNYLYKGRFSKSFIDFLCCCLKFNS